MELSTASLLVSLVLNALASSKSEEAAQCECYSYRRCILINGNSSILRDTEMHCSVKQKNIERFMILRFNETTLATNIFEEYTNLELMDFSGGSILHIIPGAFEKLSNLNILTIQRNNISTLKDYTFRGLGALEELHLESNNLTSIAPNAFDGLKSLMFLTLSRNKLTQLPATIISSSPMLLLLFLSENLLTRLPDGIFDNINFLLGLDVSSNRLEMFHFPDLNVMGLLLNNNSLTTLHFNDQMKQVQAHHNQIRTITGSGRKVTDLGLQNNGISDVTPISRMSNLTKLILNDNPLEPNSVFASLSKMEFLLLKNTSIQIGENTFANLSSMELLDLSYNNLTLLDFRMFSSMIDLETLIVAHNRIQMINFIELRVYLPKLHTLEVCDNGWNTTYMKQLLVHMKHHKLERYKEALPRTPILQSFFKGLCSSKPTKASIEESDYMSEDYSDVLEEELNEYYSTSSPSPAQMGSQTVMPIHTSTTPNTKTTPSKEDSAEESAVAASLNDTNTVPSVNHVAYGERQPLAGISPLFVTFQTLVYTFSVFGVMCLLLCGYYMCQRRFVVRSTTPIESIADFVPLVNVCDQVSVL